MQEETPLHLTLVGILTVILFVVIDFMIPVAKDMIIGVSLSLIIISIFTAFLLFRELVGIILLGLVISLIIIAIVIHDMAGAILFSSILTTVFVFLNVMKR